MKNSRFIRITILAILIPTVFGAAPEWLPTVKQSFVVREISPATAGNNFYRVHIQDSVGHGVGQFTVTTGTNHPDGPGLSLLHGNGNPGTSFTTVRSFTSGTDYIQGVAEKTSENLCVFLDQFGDVTPIGTIGFRTTYTLPGPPITPDELTIIQEVVVRDSVLDNSIVDVVTTIINRGMDPVQVGVRYLWDVQCGNDDGPTFRLIGKGIQRVVESEFLDPAFESFALKSNEANSTPKNFNLVCNVQGSPSDFEANSPADFLQFACWAKAFDSGFDYTSDVSCDIATSKSLYQTGASGGGDSAIIYYFGSTPERSMQIPRFNARRVSASFYGHSPILLTECPKSATAEPSLICPGDEVTLTADTGGETKRVFWSGGNIPDFIEGNQITRTLKDPGLYRFQVGCAIDEEAPGEVRIIIGGGIEVQVRVIKVHLPDKGTEAPPKAIFMAVGQLRQVAVEVDPGGGEFLWKVGDSSIAKIQGSETAGSVVLKGSKVGKTTVEVSYTVNNLTCEKDSIDVIVGVDLDIDSDNNNALDDPARTEAEDEIENDPTQLGKILFATQLDADADGVPDFADGFNLDGIDGNADDQSLAKFVPLIFELAQSIDLTKAKVRFSYTGASDPAGVIISGTQPRLSYKPSSGQIRLWTKDGTEARKKQSVVAGGDFVPSDVLFGADKFGSIREIKLFIESFAPSPGLSIHVVVYPDGNDQQLFIEDKVKVSSLTMDLDIDSDNKASPYGLDHDSAEESHEQNPKSPGKLIRINNRDVNFNGVPDFADGIVDDDGEPVFPRGSQFLLPGENFSPMTIALSDQFNPATAKVQLDYSGSDPDRITLLTQRTVCDPPGLGNFEPAPGKIRVWKFNLDILGRKVAGVQEGGDYVTPGQIIDWSKIIPPWPFPPRTAYLLVEGIDFAENQFITAKVVDTVQNVSVSQTDIIQYTVPEIDLDVAYKQDDVIPENREFSPGLSYRYKGLLPFETAGMLILHKPKVAWADSANVKLFYKVSDQQSSAALANLKLFWVFDGVELSLPSDDSIPIHTFPVSELLDHEVFKLRAHGPFRGAFRAVLEVVLGESKVLFTNEVSVGISPEPGVAQPSISLSSKGRRVSRQGVPLPDPGPTGEGESDRLPNQAHIDMFNLSPNYSITDVSVPVEGGELTLEFRRTSGIRSRDLDSTATSYPSENILGPGWDSNLGSRILISAGEDGVRAAVVDDLGNSYDYFLKNNEWLPDVAHSFQNDAIRCRLQTISDSILVFQRTYGTKLTYQVAAVPSCSQDSAYYRLEEVEDRNGNRLDYLYEDSNQPLLVTRIHEVRLASQHPDLSEDHPRRITFLYNATGQLTTVIDPLGRKTEYEYDTTSGLLKLVRYPKVEDPNNPTEKIHPEVNFTYFDDTVPKVIFEGFLPVFTSGSTLTRWVAPKTITDARGHVTTYSYQYEQMPLQLKADGTVTSMERPRLASVETDDGTASFTTLNRNAALVETEVTDTRRVKNRYKFEGSTFDSNNQIRKAIYFTRVTHTTLTLDGNRSSVFEYSPDANGNLLQVKDLSGNVIQYAYTSGDATDPYNKPVRSSSVDQSNFYQAFNQPFSKVLASGHLNIVTSYRYETAFNKMNRMVDGEGKITDYTIDAKGNRTHVVEAVGSFNKTTQYDYDANGFVVKIVDPDKRVTEMMPDAFGNRLTSAVRGYHGELNLITTTVMDVMGRTLSVKDPNGNKTLLEYDDLDRKILVINPAVENPADTDGDLVTSQIETHYDLNGNVIRVKDDNGVVTINTYDLLNRILTTRIRMTNPDLDDPVKDIITRTDYDAIGQVLGKTDPNGNVTNFKYDELLRLTQKTFPVVTLPNGTTPRFIETYEYGPNSGSGAFSLSGWQPTRVINKRGFATDTQYDSAYRANKTIRRLNNGNGVLSTDPPRPGEPTVETAYNKVHQKIGTTVLNEAFSGDKANQRTFLFYDDLHRVTVTVFDFNGNMNFGVPPGTFINDSSSFVGEMADFITRQTYDLAGNVLTSTDAEGKTTRNVYDGNSRLIETRQAPVDIFEPVTQTLIVGHVPVSTISYDSNGNREIMSDANLNQTKMSYDARNRNVQTIHNLDGNDVFDPSRPGPDIVTDKHYDFVGKIIRSVDGNANSTRTVYDNAYRPATVTGPEVKDAEHSNLPTSPVTFTDYDHDGNITFITDPRGIVTKIEYDELNRVHSVKMAFGTPDEVANETQYDPNNNVTALVLGNEVDGIARPQQTTYEFDPFDRRIKETLPSVGDGLVRQTVTTYYRNGNIQTVTDPKGQTIENEFDLDNRASQTRYKKADQSVEEIRKFQYDKTDHMLRADDLNGATTYTYDNLYRILTENRDTPGQASYSVQSFYDANGNRTKCVYPQTSRTLTSQYDRLNRLVGIKDGSRLTTYTYDPNNNRLTCSLPNGVVDTSAYDALNRVTQMINANGGNNVYTVTYAYDLVGNRRTIHEDVAEQGVRDLTYNYDAQYRLTSEVSNPAGIDNAYTFDLAGNRLTLEKSGGSLTTYYYDDLNELLTAVTGGDLLDFSYDLNGNRETKITNTEGGVPTTYNYDVNNRLVSASENGSPIFQASYDYRTRRLTKTENGANTYFRYDSGDSFHELNNGVLGVEFIRGSGMGGGIGSILYSDRTSSGGSIEHFTYNAVGHTVALTDGTGTATKTDSYEAFGNIASSTGSSPNNRLANTKERDASLGLDDHGHRYFDPEIGRYISCDPLGYGDGMNCYLYVGNNPINHIDPQGLWNAWNPATWGIGENEGVASFNPFSKTAMWGSTATGFGSGLAQQGKSVGQFYSGNLKGAIHNSGQAIIERSGGGKVAKTVYWSAIGVSTVAITVATGGIAVDVINEVRKNTHDESPTGKRNDNPEKPNKADKPGVAPYETGSFKELKSKEQSYDGLDIDHQPSNAAQLAAAEKAKGSPLTPAEKKKVIEEGSAVAVPEDVHQAGPTYKGKNTKAQINKDAADLETAAKRDSEAMVENAAPADKDAARKAADDIQRRNQNQP